MTYRPGAMIEADGEGIELVRIEADKRNILAVGDDRPLAERDGGERRMVRHRLRDDVDRIGVVEEPRPGTDGLHFRDDVLHDVDGAQRHEEAAGPLRLLADD